jgi:hypothetical protein
MNYIRKPLSFLRYLQIIEDEKGRESNSHGRDEKLAYRETFLSI